jgi:hypothetical protein
MLSFGMRCHVGLVRTNISEECVTSIFRVEKSVSEEMQAKFQWPP